MGAGRAMTDPFWMWFALGIASGTIAMMIIIFVVAGKVERL